MTTNWARRLSVFLGASLLLPILSEFVASRIKHEAYDYTLALSLVAVVGPVALALYYVKPVRMTARIIMSVGLMLSGLLVAALGYVLMTTPERLEGGHAPRIVGGCALGIGLAHPLPGRALLRPRPLRCAGRAARADAARRPQPGQD